MCLLHQIQLLPDNWTLHRFQPYHIISSYLFSQYNTCIFKKNQYDKKGKYRISSFLTWAKLIIDRTLLQHSYSCVLIKINAKAKTDWQSLKYYFLFGWTIRKSFPDKYTQCKHVSSEILCVYLISPAKYDEKCMIFSWNAKQKKNPL